MKTDTDDQCCNCCDERLTSTEDANSRLRRARHSNQDALLAMEAGDYEAVSRHLRKQRRVLLLTDQA